jgi:hypothetical protein
MVRQLLAVTLILFLGYGILKIFPLIAGPSLSIESPTDYALYQDGIVRVEGRVARVATLTLNGSPLLRDKEGMFSSTLTFPRGSSILTLIATDRFGRTTTKTRTIFVPSLNN